MLELILQLLANNTKNTTESINSLRTKNDITNEDYAILQGHIDAGVAIEYELELLKSLIEANPEMTDIYCGKVIQRLDGQETFLGFMSTLEEKMYQRNNLVVLRFKTAQSDISYYSKALQEITIKYIGNQYAERLEELNSKRPKSRFKIFDKLSKLGSGN